MCHVHNKGDCLCLPEEAGKERGGEERGGEKDRKKESIRHSTTVAFSRKRPVLVALKLHIILSMQCQCHFRACVSTLLLAPSGRLTLTLNAPLMRVWDPESGRECGREGGIHRVGLMFREFIHVVPAQKPQQLNDPGGTPACPGKGSHTGTGAKMEKRVWLGCAG
jgi:hypothetical protein